MEIIAWDGWFEGHFKDTFKMSSKRGGDSERTVIEETGIGANVLTPWSWLREA